MDKVYIWGDFHTEPMWRGAKSRYELQDTPLFSKWGVDWTVPAPCGHANCGVEQYQQYFATWTDAIKFAEDLTRPGSI